VFTYKKPEYPTPWWEAKDSIDGSAYEEYKRGLEEYERWHKNLEEYEIRNKLSQRLYEIKLFISLAVTCISLGIGFAGGCLTLVISSFFLYLLLLRSGICEKLKGSEA
jgi:hypothetical protein